MLGISTMKLNGGGGGGVESQITYVETSSLAIILLTD